MGESFGTSNIKQSSRNTKEKLEQELTAEELMDKMLDPFFLPPQELVYSHFRKFNAYKSTPEQLKWQNFMRLGEGKNIFEIWTKEYINAFGNYLAQRVEELGGTKENPIIILEVGAGDGRLTHFLQQKMNEKVPDKVRLIASDSGSWEISPSFPVENINHKEALEKYNPKIIICSWMPNHVDLTKEFRATKSVNEYILIGMADNNMSGDAWQTWGATWANFLESEERIKDEPLYERDGFERIDHHDLRSLQLSRIEVMDGPTTQPDTIPTKSTTVSFKRKRQPLNN